MKRKLKLSNKMKQGLIEAYMGQRIPKFHMFETIHRDDMIASISIPTAIALRRRGLVTIKGDLLSVFNDLGVRLIRNGYRPTRKGDTSRRALFIHLVKPTRDGLQKMKNLGLLEEAKTSLVFNDL